MRNIILSIYSCRSDIRSGYTLLECGSKLKTEVSKSLSTNIKEDVLLRLERGLRACRSFVSHDTVLYIEIQNQHLANWLENRTDYKQYNQCLDRVYDTLETLDCKYRFVYVRSPRATSCVNNWQGNTLEGSSVMDAFKELEGQ